MRVTRIYAANHSSLFHGSWVMPDVTGTPIHSYAPVFSLSKRYTTSVMRVYGNKPAFRSYGIAYASNTDTGTTLNVAGLNVANGDFLTVRVAASGTGNTVSSVPSGWTLRGSADTTDHQTWIYTKVAASEPGSWSWVLGSSASLVVNELNVIRDSVGDCAFGIVNGTAAATTLTGPSVSASMRGIDVVFCTAYSTTLLQTFTDPAGPLSELEIANQRGMSNTRFPHRRNRSFLPF